jgi:hypothetical protein
MKTVEMRRSQLLAIDGFGNVALGLLLLMLPGRVANWLGIGIGSHDFYASLLGAVLVGIGIALLLELCGGRGLGLTGALVINLCFGFALGGWLIFGNLELATRGIVILWGLVVVLVGLSGVEFLAERRARSVHAV